MTSKGLCDAGANDAGGTNNGTMLACQRQRHEADLMVCYSRNALIQSLCFIGILGQQPRRKQIGSTGCFAKEVEG